MNTFWIVTLFQYQPAPSQRCILDSIAVNECNALGIEEFSLSEEEVDDLLGDRSYSGGDLSQAILDEVENRVFATPTTCRFYFADEANAKDFLSMVKKECLCEAQIEEKVAQDWNLEWKKYYKPIIVNQFIEVIPSWQDNYSPVSEKQILINPGMGFGTGSHETTYLCLKLFSENILGSSLEKVLDFGSGSGILGLSVLKFFPEVKVDFYDIDSEANKNCYQNAEINEIETRSYRLFLPEYKHLLASNYELIFANILENVLLLEKDYLVSLLSRGGFLILSGILRHQVSGIINSYTKSGVELVSQLDKGDWSALLLKMSRE